MAGFRVKITFNESEMKVDFCIELPKEYVSCHAPSICELTSGDLLACCFAGTHQLEGTPEQITLGTRYNSRKDTWKAKFLRSVDFGRSWELLGNQGEQDNVRVIQPTIVMLGDGSLLPYMRSQENFIFESRSSDMGVTWSKAKATPLHNNNSGIDMVRLRSGNLVLVHNPTTTTQDPAQRDAGLPADMVGFTIWGPRTPLVA